MSTALSHIPASHITCWEDRFAISLSNLKRILLLFFPSRTEIYVLGIVHFSRMLRCPSVCPAFGHVHGAFAGLPVPPMYIEVLSLPPSSRKRKQPPRPPLGSARVQVCPVSLSLCSVVCCKVFVTSARKYPPRLLRGDSHALRPKSLESFFNIFA